VGRRLVGEHGLSCARFAVIGRDAPHVRRSRPGILPQAILLLPGVERTGATPADVRAGRSPAGPASALVKRLARRDLRSQLRHGLADRAQADRGGFRSYRRSVGLSAGKEQDMDRGRRQEMTAVTARRPRFCRQFVTTP